MGTVENSRVYALRQRVSGLLIFPVVGLKVTWSRCGRLPWRRRRKEASRGGWHSLGRSLESGTGETPRRGQLIHVVETQGAGAGGGEEAREVPERT